MTKNTDTSMLALLANEVGYDPIEDRLRQNIRATIEALFEEELAAFIARCRYGRGQGNRVWLFGDREHEHCENGLASLVTFAAQNGRLKRSP